MAKPCNKCGAEIGWREEGGRYIPLNKDGSDHKPSCSGGSKPVQFQQKEPDFKDFKAVLVTEPEAIIWKDIVNKVTEYAILAQMNLLETKEITNPALKGLITKVSFEVLNQINERKIKK